MPELWHYPFMQRALAAGLLVGCMAGFYGAFIVQRGLSFLGNGLAHAAFGGVALGLLLGAEPLAVAIPFTVIVAVGIVWTREHTRVSADTAIGIFFAVAMALGVVFLSLRKAAPVDAFAYLFGDILSVTAVDLWVSGALGCVLLATIGWWPRWAYATFDRDLALADGVNVRRDDYLLSVLIAVTIVVAAKMVGIVLIAAFFVIPAATARLLSSTFAGMTLLSVLFAAGGMTAGLHLSYALDLPSGAVAILLQSCLFFLAAVLRR